MANFLILKFLIAVMVADMVGAKNLQPYYRRSKSVENYVTRRKVISKRNHAESENLSEGNNDRRSHKKLLKPGYHHPLLHRIETSHLRKENDIYQSVKALESRHLNADRIASRTHTGLRMSQLNHPISYGNKGSHSKYKKNAHSKMLVKKPRFLHTVENSLENRRKGEVLDFEFYNRNTTEGLRIQLAKNILKVNATALIPHLRHEPNGSQHLENETVFVKLSFQNPLANVRGGLEDIIDRKLRNESAMIITADFATMESVGRIKPSKIINKRIRKNHLRHPILYLYEGSRFENNDSPKMRRHMRIESLRSNTLNRKRAALGLYKGFRRAYNKLPFYQGNEGPQFRNKNFHGLRRWIRMRNVKSKLLHRKGTPVWFYKRFRKPFNRLHFSYRNERAHGLKAAQKALQMATMSPSNVEKQTQRIQETETDYMDLVFQDSATVIDPLEEIRTKKSGLIESIVNFFKSTKSTVTESEGILEENTNNESKCIQKDKMQHVLRRPRPRMHRKRDEFHSQNIFYPKTEMNTTGQFYRPVSPVEIKEYKLIIAKTWNYTLPIKKKKSNLMEKTNLFDAPQGVKNIFRNDLTNDWAFNNLLGNRETNTALGKVTDNSEQLESIKLLEENSAADLLGRYNDSAKIMVDVMTSYATDSAKNVKGVNEINKKKVRFVAVNNWSNIEEKQDSMNVSEKYQLLKNIVAHVTNGTSYVPEYKVTMLTKLPVVLSISLSSNAVNRSSAGQILEKVINGSKATDRTSALHSQDASSNVEYFNELDQIKGRRILIENITHISTVGSIILLESKGVHLPASNGQNLNNVNEGFNFSKYHLFQNSTEVNSTEEASDPSNISNYELTSLNKLYVLLSTTLSANASSFKEKVNHSITTPYNSETLKKDSYNVQNTNILKIPVYSFKQISTTESITGSEPKYFLFIKHNKENVNNMKHNDRFSSQQQLQNATTSDNNSFVPRFDLAFSQNLHAVLSTAVSSNDVKRNNTENLLEGNVARDRTAMYGNSTKIDDFAVTSHVKNLVSHIKYTNDAEKKTVRGVFLNNSTSFMNNNITASGSNCTPFCIYNNREIDTMKESSHSSKFHPFQNYSEHTLSITSLMPKFQLSSLTNLRNVSMFFSNAKKKIDPEGRLSSSKNNSYEFFQTIASNVTLRSSQVSLIIRKKNSSEHMQLSKNVSGELSQNIRNVLYQPTEIYSTKNKTSSIFLNKGFQLENNMQRTTVANDIPYMKNRKEVYFTTLMGDLDKTRKLKREFRITNSSHFETSEQTKSYDGPLFYETEQSERIRKHAPMSLLKNIKYADSQRIGDHMSKNKISSGSKTKIIRKGNTKTFQSPLHLRKYPIFINYTSGKKFSGWQNSMNEGNVYGSKESLSEEKTQYAEQEPTSAYDNIPEAGIVS